MKIKVLITDDHSIVRSGLTMLINAQADMEVVDTASDGFESYRKASQHHPDVILMDLNMPGENGIDATARIKKDMPHIEILILTMHDDPEYLFQVLKAGASGYVLKKADDLEMMSAIRAVYRGEAYLDSGATKFLVEQFVQQLNRGGNIDSLQTLTDREQQVLKLIAKGYSNKEISALLYVSVKTIEAHRSNVMEKLQLKTRHELVDYALKKGLLELG